MNRVYRFAIKLDNLLSSPAMRMGRDYSAILARMERESRHLSGSWGRMAGSISGGFRRAIQTVSQLRRGLLGLPNRIRLSVDTSGITQARHQIDGLRDAQGRLRDSHGRFLPDGGSSRRSGSRGWLGSLGLGGFGMGALGGYLTWQGLQMAAGATVAPAMRADRNRFTAGVMLKSPEKANALDDEYRTYAKLNPVLGYKDVQGAGTQLVGVEEQYKRIMPIIRMMSDVAVGSGGNGQTLQEIVAVLGKIKSAGHLSAEELDQFTDRKIMLRPYLAKALGKKQEELPDLMRDGNISYENVLRAFSMMTGKGGVFENISERVGKETPEGKWSALKEDFEQRAMDFGTKLLPYLNKAMDFVTKLMPSLDKAMDWFVGFTKQAEGPFSRAFQFLSDNLPTLGTGLKSIMEAVGLINKNGTAAEGVINLLAGAIGGLGVAAGLLGTALKGVADVINAIPVVKATRWLYDKLRSETSDEKYRRQGTMFRKVADPNFDPVYNKKLIENNLKLSEGNLAYQKKVERINSRRQARRHRLGDDAIDTTGLLGSAEIQTGKKKKDKESGLEATVAGAKSTNVYLSIKELVHNISIAPATLTEGLEQIRDIVSDELIRAVNSVNSVSS